MRDAMMNQFEVINGYLTIVDTSRYNAFYGFRRILVKLYDTAYN
jgi:hypothetical protein